MPNIKTYTASKDTTTLPATGTAAWTQAGRRIGPLYNEAAGFERTAGQLTAQEDKDSLWPYNILKMYEAHNEDVNRANKGAGGIRARVNTSGMMGGMLAPEAFPDLSAEDAAANAELGDGASGLGQMLSNGGYQVSGGASPPMAQDANGNLIPASALAAAQAKADAAQSAADQTWYNAQVPTESSLYPSGLPGLAGAASNIGWAPAPTNTAPPADTSSDVTAPSDQDVLAGAGGM